MISLQRKSTRLALGVGAVALLALAAWALSRHSTAPLPDKGALQAPAASGNQTLHFAPGAPQVVSALNRARIPPEQKYPWIL